MIKKEKQKLLDEAAAEHLETTDMKASSKIEVSTK